MDDKPDDGWDIQRNGLRIDVKTVNDRVRYFDYLNNVFRVNNTKPLVADMYLFVKIDPDAHKCAIAGFLWREQVLSMGKQYYKGDYIPVYHGRTSCDTLLIRELDINRLPG